MADVLLSARRWRILGAALLVQVAISVVIQGFPALVPFAKVDLHLTNAGAGVFATVLSVGTMVALLPAGWAVDAVGDRRVLVAGGLATAALAVAAAVTPTFALLIPVLIVLGFAGATPTPAGSTAIVSAFAAKDRGLVIGLRQTGIPLGGAIAALLLPAVAAARGWRDAIVVAGVLAGASAVTAWWLMRGPVAATSDRERARLDLAALRRAANHDATYTGIAGSFLTVGQFVLVSYIALYVIEVGHASFAVGSIFLVAANVGGVVGRLAWGGVSDRLFGGVRRTPLIIVSAAAALGFLLLALVPLTLPIPFLLLIVFALGATVIGWNGLYIALLSEIAEPHERGRSVAYGMTLTQVGIFVGPALFGVVVDSTHSFRAGWLLVAAAMVVATVLIAQIRERRAMALTRAM